jgi:hypothetical protein
MANYKVELRGKSHEVMGLPSEYGDYPDSVLIYHYDSGDVDTRMMSAAMMLGALYDLYQCSETLKDGDTFETEFGNYVCKGVHVVPLEP